jgi:hypothetical protein
LHEKAKCDTRSAAALGLLLQFERDEVDLPDEPNRRHARETIVQAEAAGAYRDL